MDKCFTFLIPMLNPRVMTWYWYWSGWCAIIVKFSPRSPKFFICTGPLIIYGLTKFRKSISQARFTKENCCLDKPPCTCTEWECKESCDATMVRTCEDGCDIEEKPIAQPCCSVEPCDCTEWQCKDTCDATMIRSCADQCDREEKPIGQLCCDAAACSCTEWRCKDTCDNSMIRDCTPGCDIMEEKPILEPCCGNIFTWIPRFQSMTMIFGRTLNCNHRVTISNWRILLQLPSSDEKYDASKFSPLFRWWEQWYTPRRRELLLRAVGTSRLCCGGGGLLSRRVEGLYSVQMRCSSKERDQYVLWKWSDLYSRSVQDLLLVSEDCKVSDHWDVLFIFK